MVPKIALATLDATLLFAATLAGQTAVLRDTLGMYLLDSNKIASRVEVQRLTPPVGAIGSF